MGLSHEPVYGGASAAEYPLQITAHSPAVPHSINMNPDSHAKCQTFAESEPYITLPGTKEESGCQSQPDVAHAATNSWPSTDPTPDPPDNSHRGQIDAALLTSEKRTYIERVVLNKRDEDVSIKDVLMVMASSTK